MVEILSSKNLRSTRVLAIKVIKKLTSVFVDLNVQDCRPSYLNDQVNFCQPSCLPCLSTYISNTQTFGDLKIIALNTISAQVLLNKPEFLYFSLFSIMFPETVILIFAGLAICSCNISASRRSAGTSRGSENGTTFRKAKERGATVKGATSRTVK